MHTMYVDKPMRGANLMQAIARVNRTFKDKPAGLVVDYLGIAEDLRTALGNYTQRDQTNQEMGQALADQAIPGMLEKHEVVCTILAGFDWRTPLNDGSDKAFLNALSATVNYLLGAHPGPADKPCTKDEPCVRCRFLSQTRALVQLFAICAATEQARSIRDDVAFFEAVRNQIGKIEGADRQGPGSDAEIDTAIQQIVSDAMSGAGVIDIYQEAGLARPDISLIDDDFVRRFQTSSNPNLQIELLKRLLSDEITRVGRRNIVAGREFSDMLGESLLKYQNHTLDAAAVVAELAALAQHLKDEQARGAQLGLNDDELAFYDAIHTNESAVIELGDDTLKRIAGDLVRIVREDAKTDWNVKEQVRAKLRATIKRLLLRYGYPPDQEPAATALILAQAEVIASEV
jgi:type I restriction enzyme R subunit